MTTDITVVPPTCEDLYDHDRAAFTQVHRVADDSWRHGADVTEVFRRVSDSTYWSASYRISTDQETNELREGTAEIMRVYPHDVTTIEYRDTPAN